MMELQPQMQRLTPVTNNTAREEIFPDIHYVAYLRFSNYEGVDTRDLSRGPQLVPRAHAYLGSINVQNTSSNFVT